MQPQFQSIFPIKSSILDDKKIENIKIGYVVLRIGQLQDRFLWFSSGKVLGIRDRELHAYKYNEAFLRYVNKQSKFYDSGESQLFYGDVIKY
ncbi:MAG: hypothetical protein STSR0008_25430 [Ignavibacterium sp.]